MDWFSYFMIRVRRSGTAEPASSEVAGLVEQLSSGDKRPFSTGNELLDLVSHWPDANPEPPPKMVVDSDACKTNVPGTDIRTTTEAAK